jgi:hypothetical protein
MSEIKPIRPEEIMSNLEDIIPTAIIQSVNELLKEKYRGTGSVDIKQDEIINRAILIDDSLTRDEIYTKKYLDIEQLYEKYGWKVDYDKPSYRDNYDAYFTFNKKK